MVFKRYEKDNFLEFRMYPKRTIIFVHGLGLTGKVWAPQIDWCKKNKVEYVALTLPGHGERRSENILIDKMVDEIVTTAMQFEEVVLVGHSFGAFLCNLAAPRLSNVQSFICINPLFKFNQLRPLFLSTIKVVRFWQKIFGIGQEGDYSSGSSFFWRFGIYPYCLAHNSAKNIDEIIHEIRGRADKYAHPPTANALILYSKSDELIARACQTGTVLPTSGHMLFRFSPEAVNSFLEQATLRQMGHHVQQQNRH